MAEGGDIWQRFTQPATRAVQYAQEEARKLGGSTVGTEHMLLGLLRENDGVAARVLGRLGVSLSRVRNGVHRLRLSSGAHRVESEAPISWSPKVKHALELALVEAQEINRRLGLPYYVDTEHILLGLVREGEGQAARVLRALDVDPNRIRREVVSQLGGWPSSPAAHQGPVVCAGKNVETAAKAHPRSAQPFTGVMSYAEEEARKLCGNTVGTEHLLLALLRENEGIAARVLVRRGVSPERVHDEIRRLRLNQRSESVGRDAPISWGPEVVRVLEFALEEAQAIAPRRGLPSCINTEHIFLGLLREATGSGARILREVGVTDDIVRRDIMSELAAMSNPAEAGDGSVYELTVETEFSAAHSLRGYEGPCCRLHGHNYRVVVAVAGQRLDEHGMLMDFRVIRGICDSAVEEFDHQHLNELPAFAEQNPTAENIARRLFCRIANALKQVPDLAERAVTVTRVSVFESTKSSATYSAPSE